MILMIYNQGLYRECLLPNTHDSDYQIHLDRELYNLARSISLKLEESFGFWKIVSTDEYSLQINNNTVEEHSLRDRDILEVHPQNGSPFTIITSSSAFSLPVSLKYDLTGKDEIHIGKKEGRDIRYTFKDIVSSSHAVIKRSGNGFLIENLGANGTFLNFRKVTGKTPLQFGDRIDIFGLHLIYLQWILAIDTQVGELEVSQTGMKPAPEEPVLERDVIQAGEKYFNRSPRKIFQIDTEQVEIEAPPQQNKLNTRPVLLTIGPAFTMAIPMLLGALAAIFASRMRGGSSGAFMYTGVITAIGAASIGVIWGYLNMQHSRREAQENEQIRFDSYSRYLISTVEKLRKSYRQNTAALRKQYPSADICASYDSRNTKLWNRNFTHDDAMFVRLGTGSVPFQVNIVVPKDKFTLMDDVLIDKPGQIREEFKTLEKIPVGIDLKKNHLIGLVGAGSEVRELMYIITAQLASSLSYADLKLAFIYDSSEENAEKNWGFLRWYPHVWSEDKSIRYTAGLPEERGQVFYSLTNILRIRSQSEQGVRDSSQMKRPQYVLFISNPKLLTDQLITSYLYHPRDSYGITTFLMAGKVNQLPNECEDVIQFDRNFRGFYRLTNNSGGRMRIHFDRINRRTLEKQARRLSAIRLKEAESYKEIPASIDFFEMYGAEKVEDFHIADRWRKNRTYDSLRVPIGRKGGGVDCGLDLDEKYHGPHGLVAGTTGSGKSEVLQTYILSMAVNFSPEDVRFLLIDFKGGGMANLFDDLPHTAGKITNLSGNQIQRAMISISSENNRRESIFAKYGVKKIEQYTRLYKNGEAKEPLPILIIIVDEFAELKKANQDFMPELISVATVGRALGVHLILATQKPNGTVDAQIQTNTRFRLCLRVQDRQDSMDMIHKPDAAYITQVGRGYFQVGNDEIFEEFQTGYSGAEFDIDSGCSRHSRAALIDRIGRPSVIGDSHSKGNDPAGRETTQLDVLVQYMNELAHERRLDTLEPLWPPVLPEKLCLNELNGYRESIMKEGRWPAQKAVRLTSYLGRYDDPASQKQGPFCYDFIQGGNLAVVGQISSGKSTFLQTMLYSLINRYDARSLNAYILDYSGNMLKCFEDSDNVGAVIGDCEEERTDRFFHLLNRMFDARRKAIDSGSFTDYLRSNGKTMAAVLLIIDGFAAFREKTSDKYMDQIISIAREGSKAGIYLVVTSGGLGTRDINKQLFDLCRTVVSLEQTEKIRYAEVLRQTHLSLVPDSGIRGRGLAMIEGSILEFQTALAEEEEDVYERGRKIRARILELNRASGAKAAPHVPEIPAEPVYEDLRALQEYRDLLDSGEFLPAGWYRNDAGIYGINLRNTFCYLVSGSARTGKTTFLKCLAMTAAESGGNLVILSPSGSEWKKFAEEKGAAYYEGAEGIYRFGSDITPVFKARNKIKHETEASVVFDRMKQEKPIFIIITSLAEFLAVVANPGEGVGKMNGFMKKIFQVGSQHGIYFFAELGSEEASIAGTYDLYKEFTRYHQGIHLGGKISGLRLFDFQNIPARELSKASRKGNGLVRNPDDESIAIQVVVPDLKDAEKE